MSALLDDFLLRSLLAGLIMVAIAAPMGCLMVWQRLAFLSDTLGHAAVLGVGVGLMMEWHPMVGVLAVALVIVLSLGRVGNFNTALSETTLAIISHTGLAGGIIVVGLAPTRTVSLDATEPWFFTQSRMRSTLGADFVFSSSTSAISLPRSPQPT